MLVATAQGAELDGFESAKAWTVVTSDQVSGQLRSVAGTHGKALCLDYDFNGVSGYAGITRELPLDYPDNYAFSFLMRGDSPANDLQFKLVDDSGDNVWWVNRPRYQFPAQWTQVQYKRRHISRAWGPAPDPTLRHSRRIEFTIYNSAGGKGSVCFDDLAMRSLPAQDDSPLLGRASASIGQAGDAIDGKPDTAWRATIDPARPPQFRLDLQRMREFGGVVLHWLPGLQASDYRVELSDDDRHWRLAREVNGADGGSDYLALPESEARYLRLTPLKAPTADIALAELSVQPLAFAATPNDFVRSVAAQAPRGTWPRGFSGEQSYWTILGIDGGLEQGLIGEDGAIEIGKGGFSIEPQVTTSRGVVNWAGVEISQSLQDDYLPIPTVQWQHADFRLDVTAFAQGTQPQSQLVGRYRLTNTSKVAQDYVLGLRVRPLQVNPPTQFLNTVGGVSPIRALALANDLVTVEGRPRVRFSMTATDVRATAFDAQDAPATAASTGRVDDDPTGLASGVVDHAVRLAPGESFALDWIAPLTGELPASLGSNDAEAMQQKAAAQWRDKLDRVQLQVPEQGQHVVDTLRTALAHMLISRIGPRLQPGTRSYSRAWIRDGAMIGEGLLRMGREDVAEEFLRWYAPYQFDNGKVPCCVDDRGSDPVPENDSHGELVFTVAEVFRYTRDRELLATMWPHVQGAVRYMDQLRLSERTQGNRDRNAAFYGMMPASISHEGYSAKPMHSYWDNFWTLRGYKDAVEIARWLGHDDEAARFAASRDQFRDDLYASLRAATSQHGIDFLPGAAELGDFDATSTTIALAPGGEQANLPQDQLQSTFERYWREFAGRRDGTREWKDYTPYELRTIGSFVRLGWRDRAHEALAFFFADQQPQAWNQWAEVVSRTPRKPFFLGDLPHAWVASDYVRSALDMFAYHRDDDALVVAAGIPANWLAGEGVSVANLRTPQGPLGYSLKQSGDRVVFRLAPGFTPPPGGVVLTWPYRQPPGRTRIDGRAANWQGKELRIDRAGATVEIQFDRGQR